MTENGTVPTVCVCNAVDTLRQLAGRARRPGEGDAIVSEAFPQQDQSLFWLPTAKLILTEVPMAHLDWQCEFLGLGGVSNLSPAVPSGSIFDDIIEDDALLRGLLDYIGPGRRFRLIPHTTTPGLWEFVRRMSDRFQVQVELPESCAAQDLRDRLDTKSGFRALVADCGLGGARARTAEGAECRSQEDAVEAAARITATGRTCILKPDRGEASVGLITVRPSEPPDDVLRRLRDSPYFGEHEPVVVEEYIEGDGVTFPSVEFTVPADPQRPPTLTHVCEMLFGEPTQVRGNVTAGSLKDEPWYEPFVASATVIAAALQVRGYRGHFGIDAVARPDGTVFMLDLNSRRTGSTHLRDFGLRFLGPERAEHAAVGHYDFYQLPRPTGLVALLQTLEPVVRSPRDHAEGVVPCELTGLAHGRLSCVIFAPTLDRFHQLVQQTEQLLEPLRAAQGAAPVGSQRRAPATAKEGSRT